MKAILSGFVCGDEVGLILGDIHELMMFVRTHIELQNTDPYIENLEEFIGELDKEVKSRFSTEIRVIAIDTDTIMHFTKRSEEIIIGIEAIDDIVVH